MIRTRRGERQEPISQAEQKTSSHPAEKRKNPTRKKKGECAEPAIGHELSEMSHAPKGHTDYYRDKCRRVWSTKHQAIVSSQAPSRKTSQYSLFKQTSECNLRGGASDCRKISWEKKTNDCEQPAVLPVRASRWLPNVNWEGSVWVNRSHLNRFAQGKQITQDRKKDVKCPGIAKRNEIFGKPPARPTRKGWLLRKKL